MAGQYLGFAGTVAVSVAGALGAAQLPVPWLGLLLPVGLVGIGVLILLS